MRKLSINEFNKTVAELVEYRAWELVPPDSPDGSLNEQRHADLKRRFPLDGPDDAPPVRAAERDGAAE